MICTSEGDLFSPPIWADFQARDWEGRIRLDMPGTGRDLDLYELSLTEGMRLVLYDEDADVTGAVDDLVALGIIHYDDEEARWVAVVNWDQVGHVSTLSSNEAQEYRRFRPQSVGEAG